jgi:predicted RND superfamily exporter protein
MWQQIGSFTIRNRFWLLISLGILTVLAVWQATKVKLTNDIAKVVPANDPDYVEYLEFKKMFGEDGNILAVGLQSDKLFEKDFFNAIVELNNEIKNLDGVDKILSMADLYQIELNEETSKLELRPVLKGELKS